MSEQLRQQLRDLTEGLPHRDLTGAVLRRHRQRRVRQGVVITGVAAAMLAAGGWIAMAVPLGTTVPDPALSPPPVTSPSPSTDDRREPTDLTGTFYYYQTTSDLREQIWTWTVGEEPRVLAEIGVPDDLAWEYYAWHTATITSDGARVAWVPRGGDPVVVDTASGKHNALAVDGADLGCLPPVWHPDGTRLLIREAGGESRWLDVASGQLDPIRADLSDACSATVFTAGSDTVALAFEDRATHAIVAVTEAGDQLWRLDVDQLDERLEAAEGVWRLVDVADGGGHACVDIQSDVVGGPGGEPALSGNVVVDTATGAVVADHRPAGGLCSATTSEGYLSRVDESDGEDVDDPAQQLRLTSYGGDLLAVVDEPPALYFTELIGYVPATP